MKIRNVSVDHQYAKQRGWVGPKGASADASALLLEDLSTDETDTSLVPHPDGVGGVVWGTDEVGTGGGAYFEGAFSFPPTQTEITALAGSASGRVGLVGMLGDTTTGFRWTFVSDGTTYFVDTVVRPNAGTGTGGGSSSLITITSAPEGGWSWFGDPRAIQYAGNVYIGYIDASGNAKVIVVDDATGAVVNTVTLHGGLEVDDHDNPGLVIVPSTKNLIAFYSKHDGTAIYKRVSTLSLDSDPTLASGFASEVSYGSGTLSGSTYTYPTPLFTSNWNSEGVDRLWLFYRSRVSGDPYWYYISSTDIGASWSGVVQLHHYAYSKIVTNGTTRIDVLMNDHPVDGGHLVKHIYASAGAWHKSDGTTLGTPPYGDAVTTTVKDGGASVTWIWDIAYDGSGNPIAAFVVFTSTSDHRYWYGTWTGSAWSTHQIVAGGGYIPDEIASGGSYLETYYSGGLILDHDDPQIVYASVYTGSTWEIWKYVTADAGASFASTQITTSSSVKNVRPFVIRDHDTLVVLWLSGTYHSYTHYSLGITGLVP